MIELLRSESPLLGFYDRVLAEFSTNPMAANQPDSELVRGFLLRCKETLMSCESESLREANIRFMLNFDALVTSTGTHSEAIRGEESKSQTTFGVASPEVSSGVQTREQAIANIQKGSRYYPVFLRKPNWLEVALHVYTVGKIFITEKIDPEILAVVAMGTISVQCLEQGAAQETYKIILNLSKEQGKNQPPNAKYPTIFVVRQFLAEKDRQDLIASLGESLKELRTKGIIRCDSLLVENSPITLPFWHD